VFSGIVEELATVEEFTPSAQGAVLTLRTTLPVAEINIGDSIAVNGCCLTVVRKEGSRLSMDLSAETLRRTVLGELRAGDRVNVERALRMGASISGHLVTGHVDGVGEIVAIRTEGDSRMFTFKAPEHLSRYLVEKGSVAVDGVSLTVCGVDGAQFSCALIPHTLSVTTLGLKSPGSAVNIEADLLAKYVEKLLIYRSSYPGTDYRQADLAR